MAGSRSSSSSSSSGRGGAKKAGFVTSLLDTDMHNNAAFRTGSELLPGTRAAEWRAGMFARRGHTEALRQRLATLNGCVTAEECSWKDANEAAKNGHVEAVRVLREHNIHCTSVGSDWAAAYGHLELLRDLWVHDIRPTPWAADQAARGGHLEVIRELRTHGIHCTNKGADWAAMNGHLDVAEDIQVHSIR